jgi:curved DNA-binding protein CbpA
MIVMNSLYRVLGLADTATGEQIEFGYRSALEKLKSEQLDKEQTTIRLKVLQEAYSILGSRARRDAYDLKLKVPVKVSYSTVESPSLPWKAIALAAVLLIGGGGYFFKYQHDSKVKLAEAAALAHRAQAEADRAEAEAESERARLENARSAAQMRSDRIRESEQRQARYDGQRIHSNMEMYNYNQQHLEVTQAQEKERRERQLRNDQLREEQLARARVQNQNAAMQRALSIPILRH